MSEKDIKGHSHSNTTTTTTTTTTTPSYASDHGAISWKFYQPNVARNVRYRHRTRDPYHSYSYSSSIPPVNTKQSIIPDSMSPSTFRSKMIPNKAVVYDDNNINERIHQLLQYR